MKKEDEDKQEHTFTKVLGQDSTQQETYERVAQPLVSAAIEGEDGLLFAYGITNAGKTYTIQGSADEPGILPRTLDAIFDSLVLQQSGVDVFVSYLEVYQEFVYDLLTDQKDKKKRKDLKLMADSSGRMTAVGLKEIHIGTAMEGKAVIAQGQKERQTNDTACNAQSSRSHAIFTIKIVRNGNALDCTKLCLVDLAGAERVSRANTKGARLKEAGKINQSLHHLGHCFETMAYNQANPSHRKIIPFRNCKITRLFQVR